MFLSQSKVKEREETLEQENERVMRENDQLKSNIGEMEQGIQKEMHISAELSIHP